MKIAVSGKGGVGKTTLVALLARQFCKQGKHVIVIDADPDANLAEALGVPSSESIVPIVEMKELIQERTGAKPDSIGTFFKINPHVSDIPDTYGLDIDGIRLLVLGAMQKGGGGCACPENTFLRSLLLHLILQRSEVVIVDMVAGLEHLGRATVEGIDAIVTVVEPTHRSVMTAGRVRKLAADIGVKRVFVVINKVKTEEERSELLQQLDGFETIGTIGYSQQIAQADLSGNPIMATSESEIAQVGEVVHRLEELVQNGA